MCVCIQVKLNCIQWESMTITAGRQTSPDYAGALQDRLLRLCCVPVSSCLILALQLLPSSISLSIVPYPIVLSDVICQWSPPPQGKCRTIGISVCVLRVRERVREHLAKSGCLQTASFLGSSVCHWCSSSPSGSHSSLAPSCTLITSAATRSHEMMILSCGVTRMTLEQ